ncbi:MAG TPA: HNH endonuclease [Propionibacteriaceae bacterium]|nr:HNH endonuclease [Propionibacteriaceae bacterium]
MNDEVGIIELKILDRWGDANRAALAAVERVNLAGTPSDADVARIDLLRALEEVKNIATALQAVTAVAFARSQRAEQARQGVPADQLGRGVAEQVALARRESPHRGGVFLGVASILVLEMPHTLHAMATGVLTEHRAQLLVHETACVSREVRGEVDEAVAGDLDRLERLGTRRLVHLVRAETYRRDPESSVGRLAYAASQRFVAVRPAPDCMVRLTALLPVGQGVAAFAALSKAADTAHGTGDPRTRAQIMADELVIRLTGQTTAEAVPIGLHLILPAEVLLNRRGRHTTGDRTAGERPGVVLGHGPIPAELAGDLVVAAPPLRSWIRRLYQAPTGRLVAMESRRRLFPSGLAEFITIRDQICRTPYCDAPIRHIDHMHPKAAGGPTGAANGQGLCERCNHARQALGWTAHTIVRDLAMEAGVGDRRADRPHEEWGDEVRLTTPTGHRYRSPAVSGM